jgi:uncharacterized membrane protein YqaE (UPF0057 family)
VQKNNEEQDYHSKHACETRQLLLGIFVPPVGVFLTYGAGPTLIINILLALLGWLPGSIHAVWAISKHNKRMITP